MRQYAGNRVGLAVVGVLLLALGGYAWLRGQDKLPGLSPRAKILPDRTAQAIADQPWALWAAAVVLLVLALTAFRWLMLCLGWGRHGVRHGTGTAMLCIGLKDIDGLTRASARVVGEAARLRISLSCPSSADAGAVVHKLDKEIVGRIRREVRDDEVGTVVRIHVRR